MDDRGSHSWPQRITSASFSCDRESGRFCAESNEYSELLFLHDDLASPRSRDSEKQRLQVEPDSAILRLARALARQAAREDHERECAEKAGENETSRDLRTLFNRSPR